MALSAKCPAIGQCDRPPAEITGKIRRSGGAANCCKLDSTLRHHLAARTSTAPTSSAVDGAAAMRRRRGAGRPARRPAQCIVSTSTLAPVWKMF
jgi:hypothetical protein